VLDPREGRPLTEASQAQGVFKKENVLVCTGRMERDRAWRRLHCHQRRIMVARIISKWDYEAYLVLRSDLGKRMLVEHGSRDCRY
jgi:hypothetical protein